MHSGLFGQTCCAVGGGGSQFDHDRRGRLAHHERAHCDRAGLESTAGLFWPRILRPLVKFTQLRKEAFGENGDVFYLRADHAVIAQRGTGIAVGSFNFNQSPSGSHPNVLRYCAGVCSGPGGASAAHRSITGCPAISAATNGLECSSERSTALVCEACG
jgi:hypothetical protein